MATIDDETQQKISALIEEIRAAMGRRNMTCADLARATGRQDQEVGRWLSLVRVPTLANLIPLAEAVGLEVSLRRAARPRA